MKGENMTTPTPKPLGRPPTDDERTLQTPLLLTVAEREFVRRLGNGNMSRGARIVIAAAMAAEQEGAQDGNG